MKTTRDFERAIRARVINQYDFIRHDRLRQEGSEASFEELLTVPIDDDDRDIAPEATVSGQFIFSCHVDNLFILLAQNKIQYCLAPVSLGVRTQPPNLVAGHTTLRSHGRIRK